MMSLTNSNGILAPKLSEISILDVSSIHTTAETIMDNNNMHRNEKKCFVEHVKFPQCYTSSMRRVDDTKDAICTR